jgi:anti-sigma-K factor RskA
MRCHYPDLLEAGNEEIAMIDEESERHEIEALLPWYAAGTLSRREADLVERALTGDSELARRYDVVRQELTATIQLNETLGAPSARAMEKLFAAIDIEETGGARRQRQRLNRTPSLATASTLNNDAPGA